MKIDGKAIAQRIKDEVKEEVAKLKVKPKFLIIQVGDNDASNVYVRNKIKACEYCGIECFNTKFKETTTDKLIKFIEGNQFIYDGVMIQLPLPEYIDVDKVINSIDPNKDVDGLTDVNVGRLWNGDDGLFPCTALGVIELLKDTTNNDLAGRCACIIGRSNLVGKPLIALLQRENCTVVSCHSHTASLVQHTIKSDIVISAIGKPKYFTSKFFNYNQIIVDVGINRDENGKLCGDVDYEDVFHTFPINYITPVPGGVGPMTVAMLMKNILKARQLRKAVNYNEELS